MAVIGLFPLVHVGSAAGQGREEDPFQSHVRPTDPLSPAEQQKTFEVPPGFVIELVAAEPDLLKPMNMAFDAQGRLWVTVSQEYPYAAPADRPGRDALKVLEDRTGDGQFDTITTFADGLNIPIGVYPYRQGAIVFQYSPYLEPARYDR
jgi:glucose/arabinose dehydrogenase